MQGDPGRLVEDLPAGLPEAPAPVEVLHVEPVALVEQADLAHRLGAAEHEGAVDGVDLAGLVVAEVGRPVLAEGAGGAVAAADPGEVGEGAERGREGALAGVVELARLGHQLAADHPDPLVGAQPRQGGVERPRVDLGVGVEQQHRVRLAPRAARGCWRPRSRCSRGGSAAPPGTRARPCPGSRRGCRCRPRSPASSPLAGCSAASAGSAAAALRRRG